MRKILWWLASVVVIIGGVFAIAKGYHEFMEDAHQLKIDNLQSTVDMLKLQKDDVESKLVDAKNIVEKCEANTVSENLEESEISERLALMQKERDILINKALSQATNSIDPRSEIASHIALLQSESEENQASALNFLFEVRDPVTFKPLQDYFIKSESGHKPFIQLIHLWYELFLELDVVVGVDFVVSELGNQNSYNSKIAFETLDTAIENTSLAQEAKPNLEALALISENTSARGYAKILLEKISNMDQEAQ